MVKRCEVPRLLESLLFRSAWREWTRFKRFGLPNARGWRAEKPQVVRALEVLEQEYDDREVEEVERIRGGR